VNHFILMGDIIGSAHFNAQTLSQQFKDILSICNHNLKDKILSPYTTTLGDEFQGIARSLRSVADTIFYLEDIRMKRQYGFMFRYVAHYGEIETPINRKIAYGMMGPGLAHARELLNEKRRGQLRFLFDLPNEMLTDNLNKLFLVIAGLTSRWDLQDYSLILDMLSTQNNDEVAEKHGKDRSQIWKRRRHLLIEEYRAMKSVVLNLTETMLGEDKR
jgi:hypothetical protein